MFRDTRPQQNVAGLPTRSGQAPPAATFSGDCSDGIIVSVVRRGDGANFGERLVAQDFAVFENCFESVIGREGRAFNNFDSGEILAVLEEVEAASLAGLAGIGFRIFVNVVPLAVAVDGGTLQRKLQRVAVDLLQQRAAHAIAPDILRPSFASELRGDVLNGVEVHAIALDKAHARNGGLPAFSVYFVAEFLADNFKKLFEDRDSFAGIRTNYPRARTLKDFFAQRAAPDIAHGIVDIVRIADAGDDSFGTILEHVGVSAEFVGFAPCGDGGMFGSGNAESGAVEWVLRGEIGGIKLIEDLNGGKCIRAEKIQQMRGAADSGGFLGGNAAESEIVELKGKKRRIAGANQSCADDLLDRAGECGNGDGIPDLDKKRFGPVGEPVGFGVGVFDGDERVVSFDDGAFLDGADAERQSAAVFRIERFETFVVESFGMAGEMSVGGTAGFFDIVECEDLSGKIGFDDVLQHGEHGFFKHAAAGFEVGIDVARVRGILPSVGELVGVRVEDGVQPKRLHGAPWVTG